MYIVTYVKMFAPETMCVKSHVKWESNFHTCDKYENIFHIC